MVPRAKSSRYWTPVAVLARLSRGPCARDRLLSAREGATDDLHAHGLSRHRDELERDFADVNVCPTPITWRWPFVQITAAVGAAGLTWTGLVTSGFVGRAADAGEGVKGSEGCREAGVDADGDAVVLA